MANPFQYALPEEKIAQRPKHPPDAAKLLVVDRGNGSLQEKIFSQLSDLLTDGDVLVFNDTKVMPYRLFGTLRDSIPCELLLLGQEGHYWKAIGRPLRRFKEGSKINIASDFFALIEKRLGEKEVLISFSEDDPRKLKERLFMIGTMPIPPYIREGKGDAQDKEDYQTIFARIEGSIAAPTASLHFTKELVDKVLAKNVSVKCLTLHVGPASFLPLWSEEEEGPAKSPSSEQFYFNREDFLKIQNLRDEGKRIIAVGTTVVRALESCALLLEEEKETGWYDTELFIEPGYEFKCVDAIITNFHQPRTTHLLLVEAFLGDALLKKSYSYALGNDFRFLSYGDGMMLV